MKTNMKHQFAVMLLLLLVSATTANAQTKYFKRRHSILRICEEILQLQLILMLQYAFEIFAKRHCASHCTALCESSYLNNFSPFYPITFIFSPIIRLIGIYLHYQHRCYPTNLFYIIIQTYSRLQWIEISHPIHLIHSSFP